MGVCLHELVSVLGPPPAVIYIQILDIACTVKNKLNCHDINKNVYIFLGENLKVTLNLE